jgi:hypothetical protein
MMEDPYATPEQDNNPYSPWCETDQKTTMADRKNKYMNNFQGGGYNEEVREAKYRTLLDEINAEAVDVDYNDYDEISSLGGSTEEMYSNRAAQSQQPFASQKSLLSANNSIRSNSPFRKDSAASSKNLPPSNYNTPAPQGHLSKNVSVSKSDSNSDLSNQEIYNNANRPSSMKAGTSPLAGKSLHSAQAIQQSMNNQGLSQSPNTLRGLNNQSQPKSAMKNTNPSTASSVSANVSKKMLPPAQLLQQNSQSVKFKAADDIMIKNQNSSSADNNMQRYNQRASETSSKSMQNFPSLHKAFSFHGETALSSTQIMMDSPSPPAPTRKTNNNSPLRVTSNNTIGSRSSSGGMGGGDTTNDSYSTNNNNNNKYTPQSHREYPILKQRVSTDNAYQTPQSADSLPDQSSEWKASRRKFGVQAIDLETPDSIVFQNVDSNTSYKFLSASKKPQRNIDDFDSPDLFTDNDNDSHSNLSYNQQQMQHQNQQGKSAYYTPMTAPSQNTPVPSPNYQTPMVGQQTTPPRGATSTVKDRYQQAQQQHLQQVHQQQQQQHQQHSTPPKSSPHHGGSPVHQNYMNAATSPNSTAMKMKNKEQLKLYLLIGNVQKAIQLLNEQSQRLSDYFSTSETIDILWQLVKTENINDIPLLNQSILFLFDEKMIPDINLKNSKGESLLQVIVLQDNEYLGRELIHRGADILMMDKDGLCPLSISLTYHFDWLADEFMNCGREIKLLTQGTMEMKFQYFTFFILTGYSEKAYQIIENEYLTITPEEATDLMNSCRGNFENMKNPVETFELLESLGATVFDG